MRSTFQSFGGYEEERAELLRRCDLMEVLWSEIRVFATRTEGLGELDGDGPADVVSDAVARIRERLRSSMVEVGVFGEVKRGKSTLLNALLGEEVSSMRVTPETAVPVWVERGVGDALVIYVSGRTETVEDPAEARERMTQRYRRLSPKDPVARVVQQVDADWLPDGVRLVDTPGLSDPSLSAEYEELTLAELDRVSTAIFVFVSPPGIAAEEAELLAGIGEHGIDKAFLVCNFYPEQWASADDRAQAVATIRDAVTRESGSDVIRAERLKVYEVNARAGFEAAVSGNAEGVQESGIAVLREAVERHVAEHALRRLTVRSEGLLNGAKDAATEALDRRIRALSDRSQLEAAWGRQKQKLAQSQAVMTSLEAECRTTTGRLKERLIEIMVQPFLRADKVIEAASSTRELEGEAHRLRLASETAASKAASSFSRDVTLLEERVRRQLFESFGIDERFSTDSRADALEGTAVSLNTAAVSGAPDAGSVGLGALAAGTAGAFVGGSLAGGIGIALIAAGPVGWLIGAGLGALIGGTAGGVAGGLLTKDSISPQVREQLRADADEARRAALDEVRATCSTLERQLVDLLRGQQDRFLGDERRELARIEELLTDGDGAIASAVRDAQRLRASVAAT